MATIQNIVDRALVKAGVKDVDQDAEPSDQATVIDELNDMMLEWHQLGIWAKYTPVSAIGDPNTAYSWMRGVMKNFLAIRICPEFQRPVPEALAAIAGKQWKMVTKHFDESREMGFPDTLMVGNGNSLGYAGRYHG